MSHQEDAAGLNRFKDEGIAHPSSNKEFLEKSLSMMSSEVGFPRMYRTLEDWEKWVREQGNKTELVREAYNLVAHSKEADPEIKEEHIKFLVSAAERLEVNLWEDGKHFQQVA